MHVHCTTSNNDRTTSRIDRNVIIQNVSVFQHSLAPIALFVAHSIVNIPEAQVKIVGVDVVNVSLEARKSGGGLPESGALAERQRQSVEISPPEKHFK